MDLLDRYLASIRQNLPAKRADDITAELREDLLDRVEAQETRLGRPLDEAETSALIKAFGHPLVIAGRYREHQYLIGPETFPFYLYTLRVAAVIMFAMLLFASAVPVLVAGGDPISGLLQGLGRTWGALITGFGVITFIFAIFERYGVSKKHVEAWKPAQLSVDPVSRGKWESPIEVGLNLLLLLCLVGIIPVSLAYSDYGIHIGPTAVWSAYYWPIVILVAGRLVHDLIQWLKPNWATPALVTGLGTALGGIWVVGMLSRNGPWVTATAVGADAAKATQTAGGVNMAIGIALTVALIAWGFGIAVTLYRYYQRHFVAGK